MEAGDYVAIYAAVVATAALLWNIHSARSARQRRVEVKVAFAFLPMTAGPVLEAVTITAINNGQTAIRADGAGLDAQDGSGGTLVPMQVPPGADLPGVIEPNQSRWTYLLRPEVESQGFDLHRPLTGWVRLATGEVVRSAPTRLLSPD